MCWPMYYCVYLVFCFVLLLVCCFAQFFVIVFCVVLSAYRGFCVYTLCCIIVLCFAVLYIVFDYLVSFIFILPLQQYSHNNF